MNNQSCCSCHNNSIPSINSIDFTNPIFLFDYIQQINQSEIYQSKQKENNQYEETTMRVRVNKELYEKLQQLKNEIGNISLNDLIEIMYNDYITKDVIEYSCHQYGGCSNNCPCVYGGCSDSDVCKCPDTCWCKRKTKA